MSDWKNCQVEHFIEYKKGFAFKSSMYTDKGEHLIIRVSDTTDNSINIQNCHKIESKNVVGLDDFILKASDIIIATVGSWAENPASIVGKVVRVPNKANGAYLNQNAVRLRAKDKILQNFLYYLLKDKSFSDYLLNNAQGSANQASITLKDIFNYTFLCPPLPEQQAIASVLSSLDDKIDLLHRQNKTLEAMAETLFRQWFIEEAKDDWEEKKVLDIFSLVGGGTPKTSEESYWNGEINWLSGGDIAQNHKQFVSATIKTITEIGLNKSSTKLLPQFATVISARGTVGKYTLLSKPMTFSQSNYGIIPNNHENYFFTYLVLSYIVDELISSAYGSVFDTITTRTFEDVKIKLPNAETIELFEKEITPIFLKKLNNSKQIQTLENLRDTLLPKLMSGEIRVQH